VSAVYDFFFWCGSCFTFMLGIEVVPSLSCLFVFGLELWADFDRFFL